MRTLWRITTVASCFVALAFSAPEPKRSENSNAYPHGTWTCMEGSNGPGVGLLFKQDSRCEGKVSYPYLEVDVRPFSPHFEAAYAAPFASGFLPASDEMLMICPAPALIIIGARLRTQ